MQYAMLLLIVLLGGCGQDTTLQWKLPKHINEVSGLSASSSNHVLLHDDEKARVYEFNIDTGAVRPLFQIDEPVLKGDFEGVAVLSTDVILMDSKGTLYQVHDGINKDGDVVSATKLTTGEKNLCEFEGLTGLGEQLLLLCKTTYKKKHKHHLVIMTFDLKTQVTSEYLNVPFEQLGLDRLHPSGIAVLDGDLVMVAARQNRVIRLTAEGALLSSAELDKKSHRQTEGVAVLSDGRVFVADEGKSKGGRITQLQL